MGMPIVREDFAYTQQNPHHTSRNGNTADRKQSLKELDNARDARHGSLMPEDGHDDRTRDEARSQSHMVTFPDQESQNDKIARIKREQKRQWLPETVSQPPEPHQDMPAMPTPARSLLPAAIITSENLSALPVHDEHRLHLAASIERPRSALHAGDFRQRQDSGVTPGTPRPAPSSTSREWISTSPTAPWATPPVRVPTHPARLHTEPVQLHASEQSELIRRSRAASYSSLSSSYVPRPPTSPLVLQSNSNDLDIGDDSSSLRPNSPDKSYRRRTYSPSSLQTLAQSTGRYSLHESYGHSPPSFKRQGTFPTQAHQPRRSLQFLQGSLGADDYSTLLARSRRPSAADSSPLQHAPLVGRYEESILRGRMSTTPSRPLDFVARIGVLGKGKCKASLRCPPHVTVPFPAVFYDYKHARDRSSLLVDGPSPYVGQIDLENNLKPNISTNRFKRDQSPISDVDSNPEDIQADRHTLSMPQQHRRHQRKAPRGSYRIPQQGQLQIVIKNPNKTAVKLFLVPYDLTGMESGQKTFIRQRSYSWGPIIDMPLTARRNLGTQCPEAALSTAEDPNERPVLRYLIHLHICSPSRGRFYLYNSIRIVFANRVPDGKEKLRVETQLPEPRFTPWKPELVSSKRTSTPQVIAPIFTPRPMNPADRPVSVGEFTQHLEENFNLRRVSSRAGDREENSVLRWPDVPAFDFYRQLTSQRPTDEEQLDFTMPDSNNFSLSPKAKIPPVVDAMSWAPQSPLQNRHNTRTSPSTSAERDVVIGQNGHNGNSRPSTPRSGREGLLALQLRDWAEQSKGQKST